LLRDVVLVLGARVDPRTLSETEKTATTTTTTTTTTSMARTTDGSRLQRRLSARQVQMIAIAGTIGTGLFLGTGRSLATGGPASMLICYLVIGFIVYVTLLLLGEMSTQYPVAGASHASYH
jgi:AAT family amino acid transporter